MGNSHASHSSLYDQDGDDESHAQDVSRYLSSSSLDREGAGGASERASTDSSDRNNRDYPPVESETSETEHHAAVSSQSLIESDEPYSNIVPSSHQSYPHTRQTRHSADNNEAQHAIPLGLDVHQQEVPHMWDCLMDTAVTPAEDEMWDAQVIAQATCSFLSSDVGEVLMGDESWDAGDGRSVRVQDETHRLVAERAAATGIGLYSRPPAGLFFPWMPRNNMVPSSSESLIGQDRREGGRKVPLVNHAEMPVIDFYPPTSQHYEWMGRSIESLLTGHCSAAPVLALPEQADRAVETATATATEEPTCQTSQEGKCTRRTSVSSLDARRSPHRAPRRTSLSRGATYRRTSNCTSVSSENAPSAGPNVLLSLLAREGTGKPTSRHTVTPTQRLRGMGGTSLYNAVDEPAGGIVSEVSLLEDAIDRGDWTETQIIVSRLAPRLVGDPSLSSGSDRTMNGIDDPSLPVSAPRFHAGGGRLGLEREAFVLSGGVTLLLRVFKEPAFVGDDVLIQSNDARDLSDEVILQKLASCWNEVFASLRELVYALPVLVDNGDILDGGDFVPFLFTLLAHDPCFDGAAALIEEILSTQSNSQQPPASAEPIADEDIGVVQQSRPFIAPPSTFFLGNVPDLYELWDGFSCRQLAHFCRLLVLLVFEPEDRQVLDSPSVLRSVELLQIRRDRAARAGRDSTVDMNQAILIGDVKLMQRLLMLLRVMNFAPPLTNSTPYHVMTHFPFVAGTLPMVGLSEITDFREIDRLESLARTMISESTDEELLSDLGTVTDMLESLSNLLRQESLEQSNQIGHIINIINAAQQAGVVVGMPNRSRPTRRERTSRLTSDDGENLSSATASLTDSSLQHSLHSAVERPSGSADGVQVVRRIELEGGPAGEAHVLHRIQVNGSPQMRISSPEDAANELQFNAFMLAPYQVEVLFVLCTLIGGRRKIDSQNILKKCGLVSTLGDLFHRLPLASSRSNPPTPRFDRVWDPSAPSEPQEEAHGIHGPGCECTPESAMSVQFLRLLHNFCDRDCDNHNDRRLLLSMEELEVVFSKSDMPIRSSNVRPGLLSKVIQAFMTEPDDSPYRFWLASCVESFLRGSSTQEQLFVSQSGLLAHLVYHVTSDRIHCAGSLQTSFDLLGELCKGNFEVVQSLLSRLDEQSFQRLMKVTVSNLVDSNVFVRSLFLTVERRAASQPVSEARGHSMPWTSKKGPSSRFYLTHSWWNPQTLALRSSWSDEDERVSDTGTSEDQESDLARPSDWFPPFYENPTSRIVDPSGWLTQGNACCYDWIYSPGTIESYAESEAYLSPNSIERLHWFLEVNITRLLLDLFEVVSLKSINHENICCLNTAVIVMMFAYRRGELCELLNTLKTAKHQKCRHFRPIDDGTIVESMQALDIVDKESHKSESSSNDDKGFADAIHNFRELVWFWTEYYTHRGRDRISLEFSSHTRFIEWRDVVSILSADDGSGASLLAKPPRLPRSPYQCAPRVFDIVESHARGA